MLEMPCEIFFSCCDESRDVSAMLCVAFYSSAIVPFEIVFVCFFLEGGRSTLTARSRCRYMDDRAQICLDLLW